MNDKMNALNPTVPISKGLTHHAAYAVTNTQGLGVPKAKENNMSILKVWREHRQRLIKPCMRKY